MQAAQQKPEWLVTKWEFAFPQLLNVKEKHKLSKNLEQKILTKELNDGTVAERTESNFELFPLASISSDERQ